MGDISELRGLITVISFLGACALLFAFIPTEFYTVGEEREVEIPDLFESMDIYAYAETKSFYMNETGGEETYIYGAGEPPRYEVDLDLGNWDTGFIYQLPNASYLECSIMHYAKTFFGLLPDYHELKWKTTTGESYGYFLRDEEMQESPQNGSIFLRPICKHTTYDVYFAYNASIYANFTEAWNYHGLAFFAGVNFDEVNTSYNAWAIIGALLWFKMPNMPFWIQGLLSISIWACIGYLIFILVLRAIGAIFGGGA